MKEPRKIGLSSPEFTPVDCPTMDDRLGNEVLKSSGRRKQEKNDIHKFSMNVGTICTVREIPARTVGIPTKVSISKRTERRYCSATTPRQGTMLYELGLTWTPPPISTWTWMAASYTEYLTGKRILS